MNLKPVLEFLCALRENNNKEWFHAHKTEYQNANRQFEELLQELIFRIGKTDESIRDDHPHELTFKLQRDTRFSHDKSPYNPAFRAHIAAKGKLPVPVGYYIMIKPGNQSFLGGGLFTDMFKDATAMVRTYISENPAEWEEVIHAKEFQELFTVQGSALKNVPAGYDKAHPQAEFLKCKSWYLEYPVNDGLFLDSKLFLSTATDIFLKMKPFNDYLNKALSDFQMPAR